MNYTNGMDIRRLSVRMTLWSYRARWVVVAQARPSRTLKLKFVWPLQISQGYCVPSVIVIGDAEAALRRLRADMDARRLMA